MTTPPLDASTRADVVAFHGHDCPGLAMGIQAARLALREVGPHAVDEEVVAVVETDMCGVDAIQFLTGCTFGKGNLVHRDHGKNAYTFFRRADGHAVRIVGRPDAWPEPGPDVSESDRRAWRVDAILAADPDELFHLQPVDDPAPPKARIDDSQPCAACGEATMVTRLTEHDGRELCVPCLGHAT